MTTTVNYTNIDIPLFERDAKPGAGPVGYIDGSFTATYADNGDITLDSANLIYLRMGWRFDSLHPGFHFSIRGGHEGYWFNVGVAAAQFTGNEYDSLEIAYALDNPDGTKIHFLGVTDDNTIFTMTRWNYGRPSAYDSTLGQATVDASMVRVSVNGSAGNDLISSTQANEAINGGVGLDTVVYSGLSSQYQVNTEAFVVTDTQRNRDGSDALSNVERLKFTDTNLAFDSAAGQIAGEAYRIYKAAFDRAPDAGGLGFWINALDNGASLTSVAAGFINSPEFQKVFGANLSDRDYITKLYNNALDRNPDQGGYDFWLGALANGASREDILVNFSESKENIANVANLIANGIQYQEYIG